MFPTCPCEQHDTQLNAVNCQHAQWPGFYFRQQPSGNDALEDKAKRESRENNRTGTFNQEQVAPVGKWAGLDLKDTESKKAGEGRRNGLSSIEYSQAASELPTTIKPA